jgi:hypothetical protein
MSNDSNDNEIETETIFQVCPGCATGLVNDDWTHIPPTSDGDETMAHITWAIEHMGLVSLDESRNYRGCVTCFCCDEISYAPLAFVR